MLTRFTKPSYLRLYFFLGTKTKSNAMGKGMIGSGVGKQKRKKDKAKVRVFLCTVTCNNLHEQTFSLTCCPTKAGPILLFCM